MLDLQNVRMGLTDLRRVPLRSLAIFVRQAWVNPYFGARPYIEALCWLDGNGMYGCDDWRMLTLYFLSNARTWKGEEARLVKEEMKRRVKVGAMDGGEPVIKKRCEVRHPCGCLPGQLHFEGV